MLFFFKKNKNKKKQENTDAAVDAGGADVGTGPVLVDLGEQAAAGHGTVFLGGLVESRVVVLVRVVEQVCEGHVNVVAGDQLVLVALQVAADLGPGIEQPVGQCEGQEGIIRVISIAVVRNQHQHSILQMTVLVQTSAPHEEIFDKKKDERA
jgi:hypothetical protein